MRFWCCETDTSSSAAPIERFWRRTACTSGWSRSRIRCWRQFSRRLLCTALLQRVLLAFSVAPPAQHEYGGGQNDQRREWSRPAYRGGDERAAYGTQVIERALLRPLLDQLWLHLSSQVYEVRLGAAPDLGHLVFD